jgi:hypothetical protein
VTPTTGTFPFPAQVTVPTGGTIDQARLAVVADPLQLRVFINNRGTIELAHEVGIATFAQDVHPLQPGRPSWTITDTDGGVWTIVRGKGCGCSNPLKHFRADAWVRPSPVEA